MVASTFYHQTSNDSDAREEVLMAESEAVIRRIRAEFREMPGLRLTPAQATKLWGLDREVCRAVIDSLVAAEFLKWTATGAVARADD